MDLLKVFPGIEAKLQNTGSVLWTLGRPDSRTGRLNHPMVWNSHGTFVWSAKPDLKRDKHGWFSIDGCVSDCQEIECTWLEFLRDAWCHHIGAIILPHRTGLPAPPQNDFMQIMYEVRGWTRLSSASVEECRARSLRWLTRCDAIWNALYGDHNREMSS